MASEKITAIIDEIKTLTILEVADLVKALEEEFGVSAAPVAAVAVGGAVAVAVAGQHGHDVGDDDLLVVELFLTETGIVDVLDLDADALVEPREDVAAHRAGACLGIGVLVAVKRHGSFLLG